NPLLGRNIGEHVTLGVVDAAHDASCLCDVQRLYPIKSTYETTFSATCSFMIKDYEHSSRRLLHLL
ncbi:MAG TPA: hypothetical protein VEF33_09075, partial [Syntrophales bacterium]|nr:hypothetical protein [Syntrophales bacterium]